VIPNATLHHVGVATENALLESKHWELFGLRTASDLVFDPAQRVNVLFLSDGRPGGTLIELVEPASADAPVNAILKTQNRFYHVCFEVDDLEQAVRDARSQGALIVQQPVKAAAYPGRRIAWCFTATRNLIELLERERPDER